MMGSEIIRGQTQNYQAWAVFQDSTEIWWWLRIFLKPGFRHCFALIKDNGTWVSIDPLGHHTEVEVHHHLPADYDLPAYLCDRGFKAVPMTPRPIPRRYAPVRLFSCVEAVKRILGIHAGFVLTPYQLYKHLLKIERELI